MVNEVELVGSLQVFAGEISLLLFGGYAGVRCCRQTEDGVFETLTTQHTRLWNHVQNRNRLR